jgi:hypothetical protein
VAPAIDRTASWQLSQQGVDAGTNQAVANLARQESAPAVDRFIDALAEVGRSCSMRASLSGPAGICGERTPSGPLGHLRVRGRGRFTPSTPDSATAV